LNLRFHLLLYICIAAHLLLLTGKISASVPDQDSIAQVPFQGNIIVTASRIPLLAEELSRSVISMDNSYAAQLPAGSVHSLLDFISGIDIRQQGMEGVHSHVHIRGAGYEQSLILIDGAKVNDPQTGHHNMHLPLQLSQIKKIEVLKGPASRIFGPSAFGGAINIITDDTADPSLNISARLGEFQSRFFNTAFNSNYKNSNHSLTFNLDQSDGYRRNTAHQSFNGTYRMNLQMGGGSFNLFTGYRDKEFGANQFYGSSSEWQWEELQTSFLNMGYNFNGQTYFLENRVYWRRNKDHYIWNKKHPEWYENFHTTHVLSAESQLSVITGAGVSALRAELNGELIESNNLGEHQRNRLGIIGEHHFRLAEGLLIIPGASVFKYSDWGWQIWPGLDSEYRINPAVSVYASINSAFRPPTFTELYYSDPDNTGNKFLQPEKAFALESGYRYTRSTASIQVSLFRRWNENLIDWIWSEQQSQWQALNITDVQTTGVETEFKWINNSGKNKYLENIRLGYTYLYSRKDQSKFKTKYLINHLRHDLSCMLLFWAGRNLRPSLTVRYEDRVGQKNVFLADSRISWLGESFKYYFDILNIFDQDTYDFQRIPLPGRHVRIGMSYTLPFE